MKTTGFTIFLTLLAGQAALARDVQPKRGTGPVYHLFGPHSLSTGFLPTLGGGGAKPHEAGAPEGPAYVEPSTHDVLHEMFVTGDPNAKPGASFPKGRATGLAN